MGKHILIGGFVLFCFSIYLPAQQLPELILPVGHASYVTNVEYSPDGKFIITTSADNTAIIWEASSGKMLHQLKKHTGSVDGAQFTADGKYVATSSADSLVIIWETGSGGFLNQFKCNAGPVESCMFSPDGNVLIALSRGNMFFWDYRKGKLLKTVRDGEINTITFSPDAKEFLTSGRNTVTVWENSSIKKLRSLKPASDDVMSVAYSPDGKNIAARLWGNVAIIWETSTGNILQSLNDHKSSINNIAFSPNGKYLLTVSKDSTAIVYNTDNYTIRFHLKDANGEMQGARFSPDGRCFITSGSDHAIAWETGTGKMLYYFKQSSGNYKPPQFSPDGKWVAVIAYEGVKIFEYAGWKMTYDLIGHADRMYRVQFSPDSKNFIAASWDKAITTWETGTGKLVQRIRQDKGNNRMLAYSPDASCFVTVSSGDESTIKIWDKETGKMLRQLSSPTKSITSLQFSPDGKYIVAASSYGKIAVLWEVSTGREIQQFTGAGDYINSVQFSPDGKKIVASSDDKTAAIWESYSGKMLLQLTGHQGPVESATFSPDGKNVFTTSFDNSVIVWNSETGKIIYRLPLKGSYMYDGFYSADGKYIIAVSDGETIVWRSATGKRLMEEEVKKHWGAENPFRGSFNSISPDSRYIITAQNNTLFIHEMERGKIIRTLQGHNSDVLFANYSPNGKWIISCSNDNILKFWDAANGQLLYSVVKIDTSEYLAIDRFGRYDGTEAARKLIYYTCGTEIIDLDQFKDLCWEPGLVSKIMGINEESIKAKTLNEIDICNRTPRVENKGEQNGTYNFNIIPQKGGISDVALFVNGKQVKSYKVSQLAKSGNNYLLNVSKNDIKDYLPAGQENSITVKASTADGSLKSRGVSEDVAGDGKNITAPNLYTVAVGVSDYKGEKLRLSYASKDARDFTSALNKAAKKLFNVDGKEHVQMFTHNSEANNSAYKADIRKSFEYIANKATANDILVIFLAGHGVLNGDKKQFYYLTADASALDITGVEKEVSISTEELDEWMRKIKAQKQLLILDACNSGQALSNMQELKTKRDIPADQRRALERLKDRTGTFILTASAANQAAYETSLYGQGLLTYSLLYGMKTGAGLRENKFLDVTQWFNASADQVQQLAKDIGGRQEPQLLGKASFDVGIVDKEVANGITLSIKKLFGRSNFQNDKMPRDNLSISVLVDKQLNESAARGVESQLVFVPDNTSSDSYGIGGRYTVTGNAILLKVSLFKGADKELYHFEQAGTIDKLEKLAIAVMEKINKRMEKEN